MIIGIGTDIVSRERLDSTNVESKFLNQDELLILEGLNGEDRLSFISGRWAAKEAIVKASNKEYTYANISILNKESGIPYVRIDGIERVDIKVSISHEKDYTVAFSVITKV